MLERLWRKGNPQFLPTLLVGMKTSTATMENSVKSSLKKLKIELAYDQAILLLGIRTQETRTERDTCTPIFIAALFTIARTWKQPRCPSADEWVGKLQYLYIMEYYSAIKKNGLGCILTRWMKLEPIIQSEVSQKEKHQYSKLMHIYGIQKDSNEQLYIQDSKRDTVIKNRFWTMWEKARVGQYEGIAFKHIYCHI